ncbi:MAG: hypothetical protein R3358_03770 [Woeseiaceae bacterium]|nr:hypothetical protein [Woeseiaceae bacterium]
MIASLLCSSAFAESEKERLKCEREIRDIIEDHEKRAAKLTADYEKDLDKLIARHSAELAEKGGPADELQSIVDSIVERWEIERYRKELIDDKLEWFQSHLEKDDDVPICRHVHNLERNSDRAMIRFESGLDAIRDDVDNRLGLFVPDADEGLAIIAFKTTGYAERIRINRRGSLTGRVEFGPVSKSLHLDVLRLKAGEYNWDEVSRRVGDTRYFHNYGDSDFTFTITPGKINYVGLFVYDVTGRMARGSLNDRPSVILPLLEEKFPELIGYFDIVNGLVPDDRYIDFYYAQRARHAEGADESR